MSQEPRMRLQTPDAHARRQARREQLENRLEVLSTLDAEIEEFAKKKNFFTKGKELLDKVIPGEQSTEKKKRLEKEAVDKKKKESASSSKKKSNTKNKGNECHDPVTGKFCKGKKWSSRTAGSSFNKLAKPEAVMVINEEETATKEELIQNSLLPKATYSIKTKDGTILKLSDMDGLVDKEHAELMLKSLAYNHEMNPLVPPAEIILHEEYKACDGGCGVMGWVYNLPEHKNKINLSYDELEATYPKKPRSLGEYGDFMPSSQYEGDHEDNPVTRIEYVVSHEYGHAYDFSKNRGSASALYNRLKAGYEEESDKFIGKGGDPHSTTFYEMSHYGKQSPTEAYGEAYAEWMSTSGRTTNEASRAYAAYERWPGWDQDNGPSVESYNRGDKAPSKIIAPSNKPTTNVNSKNRGKNLRSLT